MTGQQMMDAADLGRAGHAYIRFRESIWANPNAYMRLSVLITSTQERYLGPWLHLYDRMTQEMIGEPTPQNYLTFYPPFNKERFLTEHYVVWLGELDPADR